MIPYLHFDQVIAGNDFTDKQKMTYKPNLRQEVPSRSELVNQVNRFGIKVTYFFI